MKRPLLAVMLVSLALTAESLLAGCGAMESAAKKDPLKCERDPKCQDKARTQDCSRQCSDDPACVDRCREMGVTSGTQDR